MTSFRALVVRETEDQFSRSVENRQIDELPEGEALIRVRYSSLNYKDALSATGHRGVTQAYPHTPGIDAAGEIVESTVADYKPGNSVLVTGYDLGMNTPGGFGQYIRVPAHWLVRLPEGLTLKESMGYGTAGFTAALSVHHIIETGIKPDQGDIVVTGATGGVGSLAVAILAKNGFRVVAATGKASETNFLKELGAYEVIDRRTLDDDTGRPILSGRWAAAIDTVGGNILSTLIKTTQYHGVITCCGLVASPELHTTVYPFILRGVKLIGIDSVLSPMDLRLKIWQRIATDWKINTLNNIIAECHLEELNAQIDRILSGQMRGRIVVSL